jgi:hypothetical protein
MNPLFFSNADRFFETRNSRADVWASMFAKFLRNPIVGTPRAGAYYSESTLLSVLEQFGLVGGVLLMGSVIMYVFTILKLETRKAVLGGDAILVKLATANMGMILAEMVIEASPLGAINAMTLFFYLNMGFIAYLLDATTYGLAGEYSPYNAPVRAETLVRSWV